MAFHEIPGCLHDDPAISDCDKTAINVLDESESASRWDRLTSPINRHFMRLNDSEWPAKLVHDSPPLYQWLDDWNDNAATDFCSKLRTLDIELRETITVFWMRETAAEASWAAFTSNWINFLYEDEGCIVVPDSSRTSVVLSNGYSWIGGRHSAA